LPRERKNIAILGSTGSIGRQSLEVIRNQPDRFQVEVLTANSNADLLIQQSLEFKPNAVVIINEDLYPKVNEALNSVDIKVYTGRNVLNSIVEMDSIDMVLTALVGFSGLEPTIRAIEYGKDIALANKETLVIAGNYITELAKNKKANIIPVDSEHSAIFQCIVGELHNKINRIILTASGGPFIGRSGDELKNVTPEQALKHPNWDMGSKITIDSATLMNKGLEVIEAKWLFGLNHDQIEVIIHPQSIIHSMVEFEDGSIKAQLGIPDMRLPIQYAFTYPHRIGSDIKKFRFVDYPALTFEKPDTKTFRNLELAFVALRKGGNMPCILNAANEIAVDAFLSKKIRFLQIADIIESCMGMIPFKTNPGLEDYFSTDKETRIRAKELIN
jgi:1-deoxy-D-xylulose-5-phosphate reductoisomerase